jgi:hypothetical protein
MEHLDKVIKILEEIKPGVNFRTEKNLIAGHILASLEIMMLVSELNDAFDIEITLPYIKPENFSTPDTICAMVEKVMDED